MPGAPRFLVVLSEEDPVARAVDRCWGEVGNSEFVRSEAGAIRTLANGLQVIRRPGHHIFDDRFDELLPPQFRAEGRPLVFPSVHRSDTGQRCLTVHPLGNPGPSAELGGRPQQLVPTAPRLMTSILRRLSEDGDRIGFPATFEATHHGPMLSLPAMFVEVSILEGEAPDPAAVRVLADSLVDVQPEPGDRVAVAVGGGHYAPHFTELARTRRWAFGHILSRHSLEGIARETAAQAFAGSPGADGWLMARAADWGSGPWPELGRRLRDQDAPRRGDPTA